MNTDKPTNEALALRAKAGDREALAALWEQNKGALSLMVKRQYMGHRRRAEALGVEMEDAQQTGFFAVRHAVQTFGPADRAPEAGAHGGSGTPGRGFARCGGCLLYTSRCV